MSLGKYIAHNAGKFGEKAGEFIGKASKKLKGDPKMPGTSVESMDDILNRKLRNKQLAAGGALAAGGGALAYGMSDDDEDDSPSGHLKRFLASLVD